MPSIEMRTEIPGPRSRAWIERKDQVIANAKALWVPVFVERAEGALVTDVDGNTFIDFAGGIGSLAIGHSNAAVTAAVQAQVARFLHTDFTVMPYDSYVELAERLCARLPITGVTKAAFFNSGAEAVENAVKIAKATTGRQAVIAYEGAFHGRTHMAMSLTSKQHPYKAGFGPFAPEVYRVAFPYEYRWPAGDATAGALDDLRRAFTTRVAPEDVAAIIIEPIQGEGGFVPAPAAYLRGLREICDEQGIVLIADEVQTGFGRTGTLFAIEQSGVEPDLVCVAKSIAGGLPLSGVLGRAEIMDAPGESAIGGTYVGNPVACVAALAVLDEIDRLDLCTRAREIGEALTTRMRDLHERVPQLGDVRGLGSMVGLEFVRDPQTREPAPEIAARVAEHALQNGLVLLKAGLYGNVIRNLAPLVITDAQLAEALDVLEAAIEHAVAAVTA
ncbi:MAG: 4-aminobutyrate aminotransferase / (S)-3-amino-2-methylpropionate transaminase / 5-aminovalerate [Gaiellales bacterium]|nr:4-aminobutyrate aminotransferase / (S)-3-amino-2-methylpropionate transaminase / 5-aminovalerate [Gaiellales bacterium]